MKKVNWSSKLHLLFLKHVSVSSSQWWAVHSVSVVNVISVSQLTAITVQHFRSKREKDHSQINLSRPYIAAKIRSCSTEMMPWGKKNGQLPYGSKSTRAALLELLCCVWNNRKDMGTHCKCIESICIIKKMHKGIKQAILDWSHWIVFGNGNAEWCYTVVIIYNVPNVTVCSIRFLYRGWTQFRLKRI